jgi:serine/threonine-protein kinase HipA
VSTKVSTKVSTTELDVLRDQRVVGRLTYDPAKDQFDLIYDAHWRSDASSFALSPALALERPAAGYAVGAVRRFVENLLPEGRGLDVAASTYQVSKNNVFGLIAALGGETAGALSFRLPATDGKQVAAAPARARRSLSLEELRARIVDRAGVPFAVWDGKVRLSVPGYQDKLPVFRDADGRFYLAESPLASTHLLKPEPMDPKMAGLVANEHFCMTLAQRLGLPAAAADILRLPEPVLVVTRFDREVFTEGGDVRVRKRHIVDGCQATDRSVSAKYERNFGSGKDVAHIRDGVSLAALFGAAEAFGVNKAAARMALLRWALFQFVIGNSDAHGKNYSFFMEPAGLQAAPWYDLVSVVQYDHLTADLAMAYGDEFDLAKVQAFDLADFAQRCSIPRALLAREMRGLATRVVDAAPELARDHGYIDSERDMVNRIAAYCADQAQRLADLSAPVLSVRREDLR